jgi:hypothetical protein
MYPNHSNPSDGSYRAAPRPHHRLVVPDALEPWDLQDVELLLWPNAPEHVPVGSSEPGWAELLNVS